MLSSAEVTAFALSLVHGLILTFVLVAVIRMRHILLFAKAVFAIVALFTLFLFIDGWVSGPYISDVGLVCGGGFVVLAFLVYQRWRHPRNHASR